MKKSLLLCWLITLCLLSCKKENKPAPFVYSVDYRKAWAFLSHHSDSAFYYFNRVVNYTKDSLEAAMALEQMSAIQSDAGDDFGAQESLLSSLKYLNENLITNRVCLTSIYNELGLTSSHLINYEAAVGFYNRSLGFCKDEKIKGVVTNNLAYAYQQKREYSNALAIYQEAVPPKSDSIAYARVTTNIAFTKWLQNPAFQPLPALIEALRIRQEKNDQWGENSSYAHLADFYAHSHPDSALCYAKKMYKIARQIVSPDDELEALRKMIRYGHLQQVKHWFDLYQRINDSVQTARNTSQNQFALIRYNAEKVKADNLKLQKNNSDARYQIIKRNILICLILLSFIIVAIAAFFWNKKRKKKQILETQVAIKETEKKASKKVHDTLANDIYAILNVVEHNQVPDNEWLVYHIDDVYQRARDLSYEMTTGADEYFHEKLSRRLKSFATDNTRVSLVGNGQELWQRIDPNSRFELTYVLQEFMVNMQKHSGATNVVIKFEIVDDRCLITYFDNGTGLKIDISTGNGLTNTGNRIKSIHGDITFENIVPNGLQIQISIPLT